MDLDLDLYQCIVPFYCIESSPIECNHLLTESSAATYFLHLLPKAPITLEYICLEYGNNYDNDGDLFSP